jgi:hypothetical protein
MLSRRIAKVVSRFSSTTNNAISLLTSSEK